MPIVYGKMDHVEARRLSKDKAKDLAVNLGIKDIEYQDDKLLIRYEYDVRYTPEVGYINFKGHVLFAEKKDLLDKIISGWKMEKKLPDKLGSEMLNNIMWNCSILAVNLATSVNLLPPVMIPKVGNKPKEIKRDDEFRYIG